MFGTSILVLGFLATANGSESALATRCRGDKPPLAQEKGEQPKKTKPKFTIGKETTYVTGPVDKDGYIDYATALNERLRQGVTPDNNANVLLWKAMGPRPEGGTMPAEFFQWLGIPAPPGRGEYFLGLNEHLKIVERTEEIQNQLEWVVKWPWTAKQYPAIAGWLKGNEKPLALVVAATRRTHFFSPMIPVRRKGGSGGLLTAPLSGIHKCREFGTALAARALLRLAQGRQDEAWQDLLACHRLGRLVGRGGTLIEGLVGIAIDNMAADVDLVFLDTAKTDAKRLKACLRDLQQLPARPAMADKVDLAERFIFLETVLMLDRQGLQFLENFTGKKDGNSFQADPFVNRFLDKIDWNVTLRNGNGWYDHLAAAMRLKDRGRREQLLVKMDLELKKLKANLFHANNMTPFFWTLAPSWHCLPKTKMGLCLGLVGELAYYHIGREKVAKATGKMIGDILITLLVPAVNAVQRAADRTEQTQINLYLAFALAAYQREHGRYPVKLAALAPKYLPKIPLDLFSGKALIFRPAEDGYLLYSVGVNGQDDGGRSYDDDPRGDDLRVRMPRPKVRQK